MENNKVDPQAPVDQKPEDAKQVETTPETKPAEPNPFKAELDLIKESDDKKSEQIRKAEHTIETLRGKLKDKESDDGDDGKMDSEGIRSVIKEEVGAIQKLQLEKDLEKNKTDLINASSENEDERKLIEYNLEHKIMPSGNLETDVENARVLANKHRIDKNFKEIKQANESKQNIATGGGAPHLDNPETEEPLSDADKKLLEVAEQWAPKQD